MAIIQGICQAGQFQCVSHLIGIIIAIFFMYVNLKAAKCIHKYQGFTFEIITLGLGILLALFVAIENLTIGHFSYSIVGPYIVLLMELSICYSFLKFYLQLSGANDLEIHGYQKWNVAFFLFLVLETLIILLQFIDQTKDAYWILEAILYIIAGIQFWVWGSRILILIEEKQRPSSITRQNTQFQEIFRNQKVYESHEKQIKFLMYFFLPIGLAIFFFQLILGYVDETADSSGLIALFKDIFEMIPSFLLAYAFHDIPQTHQREISSNSDINFNSYEDTGFSGLRQKTPLGMGYSPPNPQTGSNNEIFVNEFGLDRKHSFEIHTNIENLKKFNPNESIVNAQVQDPWDGNESMTEEQ